MSTAAHQTDQPLMRAMGRWTLVALVLNSIIGSGIFGLPAPLARLLGVNSIPAFLIAAAGNAIIMLCFAEVASRFTRAGGAYLYTRESFGRFAGIQIGWMSWLVRLASAAAGANLFTVYLAEFIPAADGRLARAAILALLLGGLAWINIRGVSAGARMNNVFTAAKLLPLAAFIALGAWFLATKGAPVAPATVAAPAGQWFEALLLLAFAYGGYESAVMPLAEARNPRRDAPFALLTAAVALTVLYTAIQCIVLYTLPEAGLSKRPLADAARVLAGSAGAALMTLGAVISIYGFLTANVLNTPRLTYALAENGDFPSIFGRVHERFRTPHVSIFAFVALVWLLAVLGSFQWNAVLSGVGRLFNYVAVCGALIVFRRRDPEGAQFKLPVGPAWGVAGLAVSAGLLVWFVRSRMGIGLLVSSEGAVLLLTFVLGTVTWLWARRRPARN